MATLATQVTLIEGGVILRVEGDAGIAGVDRLNYDLNELAQSAPAIVIADLAAVTFMGSLAMSVFLVFQRTIAARGGRVIYTAVPESVRSVLCKVQMDRVFQIADDLEDALRLAGPLEVSAA